MAVPQLGVISNKFYPNKVFVKVSVLVYSASEEHFLDDEMICANS